MCPDLFCFVSSFSGSSLDILLITDILKFYWCVTGWVFHCAWIFCGSCHAGNTWPPIQWSFLVCLIIFSLWLSLFSLYWILIYKLLGSLGWCSNFTFSLFPSSLSFLVYDFLNFVFQLSPDVPYFFKYFSVIHSHNIYIYMFVDENSCN